MGNWTSEKEQREATARKAQDAYAAGRQAGEKADAAKSAADEAKEDIDELRAEVERLRNEVRRLSENIAGLVNPAPKRKVAA